MDVAPCKLFAGSASRTASLIAAVHILRCIKRPNSAFKLFHWLEGPNKHFWNAGFKLERCLTESPIIASGSPRLEMRNPRSSFGCRIPRIETNWNVRCYSKLCKNRFEENGSSISDNVLIRSIVYIIQKTDKWDALLRELCAASAKEITPPIAVQVIKRIKKPELAFKFFEWLENCEDFDHDSLTYSAILKVVTRGCVPPHAAIAHSLLQKKIELGFDVTPADFDYVLHHSACVGRSDMGLQLLDEMIARGFVPAITSCSLLLEKLFDSKQEDLGWELFYQMLGGKIDALDTESFNVAMKFLCVRGKLEETFELFVTMKGKDYEPNLDSFNILIKGCCEKGELKMVCDLFKHMVDIKVKPDSYTVNLLIKELCKQGRPQYGNDLFNYMRKVGWLDRKFVYTQLVESLCNYGWWLKALKIFVKMVRRGHHPSVSLYYNLMRRLCMGDRLREAFKLKDLILKKGYLPEIKIYNGLIDGICLIGRMEMVDKLLLELHDQGLDLSLGTCNVILRGYCMLGNVKSALEWMEKIKEKGWEPNTESCNSLIVCLSTQGRINEALQVKNYIQDKVEIKHHTYEMLINELTKLSDMDQASELLNEMVIKGSQPDEVSYLCHHESRELQRKKHHLSIQYTQ